MMGTKEDQDEENTQTMDTNMPEFISSDEEDTPQKTFTTKNCSFLFTFSNDGLVPEAEAIVTLKGTFVLNLFYSNC